MKKNIKQRTNLLVVLSISFILLMVGGVVAEQAVFNSGPVEDDVVLTLSTYDEHGLGAERIYDEPGLGGERIIDMGPEPVIEEERPRPIPLADFIISPDKQITNDGSAEYKIVFRDSHIQPPCAEDNVYCGAIGTKSEGWYDSEGSLIKYGICNSVCPTIEVIPLELGDVNDDGAINEYDLNYLLDYLYRGGPAPVPFKHQDSVKAQRGDINQDGIVNVGDVVALTNFLQGRNSIPAVYQRYTYKLSFLSLDSGVKGEFNQAEFTLGAGESIAVDLVVKTKNKGESNFVVSVQEVGGDYKNSVKGLLVYLPNVYSGDSFFTGQGFILSEDETQGSLIDLAIFRNGNDLFGKITFGGAMTFDIKGEVFEATITHDSDGLGGAVYSQTIVKFDISHPKVGVIASFLGSLKQPGTFKLLKGTLTDKVGNEWSLTAYGKKQFHVWTPTEQEDIVEVSVDEVEFIREALKQTTEQAYF